MKIPLGNIAHARSGDKGNLVNIGVIAYDAKDWPTLLREVTAERVKAHFADRIEGTVTRYELPNIHALNFVCTEALQGGGTLSLLSDAQGKSFGGGILSLELTP
ncbi:hypothetical protein [Bryobacter aggregatus]|uniref:AtuA-related protein n=1 Tax=Bryobacter aggregatus TaxID=360054 RepID=UPI0004E1C6AE|nr:hypothetical protein [Bryobacter aggregatus]